MPEIMAKLKEYKRVVQVARKPSKEEFTGAGKICSLGILLIGVIGFLVSIAFILVGV